jgi:cytosine/adenosine deaminase-related metal-dependent hydrolase
MPAEKVLKMMTIGGAKAAGLDHEIGSIEEGKKADLIIINQKVPHAYPSFGSDPISRIVYDHQSRDVDTVIIDGKVIIQEGHFMESDEMEILSRSEVARMELLNRLLDPVKSEIIG